MESYIVGLQFSFERYFKDKESCLGDYPEVKTLFSMYEQKKMEDF